MSRGVRITGGSLRGRVLSVGPGVRPTEGRVREALFSIWQDRVPGARLLDLFAGSGACGCEALSRGASAVVFVEQNPAVLRALAEAVETLGVRAQARLQRGGAPAILRALAERPERFDLIFADPPYAFDAYEALVAGCGPLLADRGELALEHSSRIVPPDGSGLLTRVDSRRYGESSLSFYRQGAERSVAEEEGDLLEVDPQIDVLDAHT